MVLYSLNKKLFKEKQPEQDVDDKVTAEKTKKPTIASELNNLFAKNNKPTAKSALFDSDDDNEKVKKTSPESPADTLFKPTPATTTLAGKQPAKKSQPAKVKSLFDTDDDEEDDFLPAIPKIEPKKEPTVAKPGAKKSSLFDSDNDDDGDFPPTIPKTERKKEPTVVKPVAATKSSLLFDSDSEETFKPVVPKIEPQKKEPTPAKATAGAAAKPSLFDDDNDDDLFSPLEQKPKAGAAVQAKAPASKKVSLFSDSSDADGDLFGKASATTKKSAEKLDKKHVTPSVKPSANKPLFDSTDSSPDDKKPQPQGKSYKIF